MALIERQSIDRVFDVGSVVDVPMHEGKAVTIDGFRYAIFHAETGWYATASACPHMGGPLEDGIVADDSVICPLHNRRFDLSGGAPLGHDCTALTTYPVEVRDGRVLLHVRTP